MSTTMVKLRFWLALVAIVASVRPADAQRARSPSEATVFIRVIGEVELEADGGFPDRVRGVELGTGSGFVFTPYGHVLTNHHVIEGGAYKVRDGRREVELALSVERVEVVLPVGAYEASIEAVDPELDLAVLSIAGGQLPYLAFGDSEAVAQGDAVQVFGFPFGRQVEVGKANLPDIVPEVSVTRGAVSATRTDDVGNAAYLQTSATVNPGNSGGPMVDGEGYVLGVVRLKLRSADSIGFAIPINTVKDFLTFNGYDQLLPVARLRLGPEETFHEKGLSMQLPETLEDVSPARLRVFSDPSLGEIHFVSDRLATPWELSRIEQALLAGGIFGSFQAAGKHDSRTLADGRIVMGRASGGGVRLEYTLLEAESEKILARYEGTADAVAFNRSVLVRSLESLRGEPLLTAEISAALPVDGARWESQPLPMPSAPSIVAPELWSNELSAPFACGGLPPWDSVLAMSPTGDFTVSFRVGWWSEVLEPLAAAAACSDRGGSQGTGSYIYSVEWLGVRYVVEGLVVADSRGTLQLEVVAPEGKREFVDALAREWLARNRR